MCRRCRPRRRPPLSHGFDRTSHPSFFTHRSLTRHRGRRDPTVKRFRTNVELVDPVAKLICSLLCYYCPDSGARRHGGGGRLPRSVVFWERSLRRVEGWGAKGGEAKGFRGPQALRRGGGEERGSRRVTLCPSLANVFPGESGGFLKRNGDPVGGVPLVAR